MPKGIPITELSLATRKLLRKQGIRKQRESKFPREKVRRHAIRVLAVISDLTQSERSRVLAHAMKVNRT